MNGKLVAAVLALVLTYAAVSEGMGNELRCQCIDFHSKVIPLRSIRDVKMTPSGPPCQNTEIIATLKDGREVCLDPTAKWVKFIMKAILDKAQANAEAKR